MADNLAALAEWLLVDGSSLIFRAFFGVPKTFRAPDGRLVNAVRGFSDRLATLIQERRPRRVAVATDEDWRPRWRVDLIPGYKAHRVAEPIPPELEPQMPLIMGYLEAAGVDVIGLADYEAEDIIASLAARIDSEIDIVSGDRDLFALIRGSRVRVLYPEKNGLAVVDEEEVGRRYGIPGRAYGDFAVLRGDPSDGLPGVAGVGPKKAADLLKRHGSVAGMIEAGLFGDSDREYLIRALRVVPPVETLDIQVPEGRRGEYPADPDLFEAVVKALGLNSPAQRLLQALKLLR
jgi:5'-3' exonuclease